MSTLFYPLPHFPLENKMSNTGFINFIQRLKINSFWANCCLKKSHCFKGCVHCTFASLFCISKREPRCYLGLIWWCFTSFSPSMWISQLRLGVFWKLLLMKKQWIVLHYLRVFFQKDAFMILFMHVLLINSSILSQSVPIFNVSIIYPLFLQ